MLSISTKIQRKNKNGGFLQPVLPLIPEKLSSNDEEKGSFISFELKTKENQAESGTQYKKFVHKFDEGTPQQWIDLLRDLKEIWKQNSLESGSDRVATVRALIHGESATAFEAALEETKNSESGEEQEITAEHVQFGLDAVGATVFPHRALEIQKLWMNRRMFKPIELTMPYALATMTKRRK